MYVHVYKGQQQSFPKYPRMCFCTFQTWLQDSIELQTSCSNLCTQTQCGDTRVLCPNDLEPSQTRPLQGTEREVAAPELAAPGATAPTKQRHQGYGTFAALYETAIEANKRKLLGSTELASCWSSPALPAAWRGSVPSHTPWTGTTVSLRRICLFLNEKCSDLSDKQAIIWRQYHRLWVESRPLSCQGCDQAHCVFYFRLRASFHLSCGFLSQPVTVTGLHKATFHLIS